MVSSSYFDSNFLFEVNFNNPLEVVFKSYLEKKMLYRPCLLRSGRLVYSDAKNKSCCNLEI